MLFRFAAAQGHPRAQCMLGEINIRGLGVPQDPIKAAEWLHKADDQSDAPAYSTLARCTTRAWGLRRIISGRSIIEAKFHKAKHQGLI